MVATVVTFGYVSCTNFGVDLKYLELCHMPYILHAAGHSHMPVLRVKIIICQFRNLLHLCHHGSTVVIAGHLMT